ncbi:hypothetical protein EON77_15085 [bacterium]|nr:MAG: hypothetical protein EON77_15085 [bacterium]
MPNIRPLDRWSKKHDACVECGTVERGHVCRGLCHRCYDRSRVRTYPRVEAMSVAERTRRNAQARARYAAKTAPPFPAIGARCLIAPTGEIGQIVGYSALYDEWKVRVPGEQDLCWEPCDLARAPKGAKLGRTA